MNKNSNFLRSLVTCLGIAAASLPALAEDIDIYSGVAGSSLPNVLIILDNSANWTTNLPVANCYFKDNKVVTTDGPKGSNPGMEQGKKMAVEKCALYNFIDSLAVNTDGSAKYNVGFMLLNESPNNGAYPRQHFVPVSTAAKASLKAVIKNLSIGDDKGSNADFAKALYESYLYFKGATPYQGTKGSKYDPLAISGSKYDSPSLNSCGRNYIIFITNGSPESSENNDSLALLRALGGDTTLIQYTDGTSKPDQANWADEFARFMKGANVSNKDDQPGIITHTIAVTGASGDGTYPLFIKHIAEAGTGTYAEARTADELELIMGKLFDQIQPVDSVFAAASLPVSVNARGTYLNQVYMGMFRPDATSKPRWRGNLKQYKFGLTSTGGLQLVDSLDAEAVDPASGFITPTAVSFWTGTSAFWVNEVVGTTKSANDSPDGDVVERGAAAQRLRTTYATSQDARKVLTCVGTGATGCVNDGTVLGSTTQTRFNSANTLVTDTSLGVATASRDTLINWIRGTDNFTADEKGPGGTTTIRPSVHGDVLHSRPAVVNYGGDTGVVVFYGGNDGMLHAIDGNQTTADAGKELWSFVPEELFPKLNRLRSNSPLVRLSTTSASSDATWRDYFVDGPIGVYQKFTSSKTIDKVMIFVAMRRGGGMLYAFDVTTPASPKFVWRKTSTDLAGGQTWSEPKVARIRGNTGPVLIFGGGYDTGEDSSPPSGTVKGNRVFVLDAATGTELKSFTTTRGVAADVTLVDSDSDGYIDRAYAVDLGGKVYRVDLETSTSTAKANWSMYTVADLSGGTSTGRKFFFAPDAIVTRSFTALTFGSGDREKPLLSNTHDHFFQIFDTNMTKGVPADYVPTVTSDLNPAGTASTTAGRGCYVELATGEKVVNAATSIAGTTYFGTNQPSAAAPSTNTCSADLGVARSYAMPLFCVAPTSTILHGGGLPPSPVAGIVTITKGDGTTEQVPFCIGCPNPKSSGIEGSRVDPKIKVPRSRLYWYQETKR